MNLDQTPLDSSGAALVEEAEALIWALLDDQIEEADISRLEQLLTEHDAVRRRYLDCVQLHVDLTDQFKPHEGAASGGGIVNTLMSEHLPGADGSPSPAND